MTVQPIDHWQSSSAMRLRTARIRLSSEPNAGYVVRLNEMLHQARGELIARMDADDVALPERFARQVEFLRCHPEVDVVGGAQEHIDSKGHLLIVIVTPEGHEEMQERALTGVCPINHPSVMMRRKAVLAVGGYRVEMMPAEDFDLWLRMGERGRLANLPDVITRYRVHESSVSALLHDPANRATCRRLWTGLATGVGFRGGRSISSRGGQSTASRSIMFLIGTGGRDFTAAIGPQRYTSAFAP